MASSAQTVVFLHGIGAGPESWDAQRAALPEGFTGIAPPIAGLADTDGFSLAAAAGAVHDELDRRGIERAHLCGLSLGGMVATQVAIDHPHRVESLVLSGSQVKPHPSLMAVQNAILRLLPASWVTPPGMSKTQMLALLRSIGDTDLRDRLHRISAATLVLCGTKDRANLPAARQLASSIRRAELQIVPGAGHDWNVRRPTEFSIRLNAFYASLGG